jgi:hypothetical protein
VDDGPTVYRGVRGEIAWYFGSALVGELDELEELHRRHHEMGGGGPGAPLADPASSQ